MVRRSFIVLALFALLPAGCDCGGMPASPCGSDDDCALGQRCTDGACRPRPDAAVSMDASTTEDSQVSHDAGPCGPTCARCRYGTCVPDLGTCASNDDCPGDSYCDPAGECLPYGVPPEVTHDPACQRPDVLEEITPTLQCEWNGPDSGDVEPRSSRIYSTPIVVDLNLDEDPGRIRPSIVVTTWHVATADELIAEGAGGSTHNRVGMLRVFDGRTCEEQLRFGGPDDPTNRTAYGSAWAVGDLDGDLASGGRPELVGLHRMPRPGGTGNPFAVLYAVKIDLVDGVPEARRLWYGRDCEAEGEPVVTFGNSHQLVGPGLFDLDDDGTPEIVIHQMVFDHQGCLLGDPTEPSGASGHQSTLADIDDDGRVELVTGNRVAEWDPTTRRWVDEEYFVFSAADHPRGNIAIVDLGGYSRLPGREPPNDLPEIVVVETGTVRALALDGTVILGPYPLHPDQTTDPDAGGAPTASDFDGDGYAEIAVAGREYYLVFDPDCIDPDVEAPERPGGRCDRAPAMSGMPPGVLWAQPSIESSSGQTGSSVFDFNGDGIAEVVYSDECYVRVYEGASGDVIFSAAASSGTGREMPVIADVDGDFATEIVVSRTVRGESVCGTTDPLFSGAEFVSRDGFVVYRDPEDRWAGSRPIWNQDAYSVTHVTDEGRVQRTSEWRRNWTVPGLNNFRQNVQGSTGLLDIADLTVVFHALEAICSATLPAELTLSARVCNRGTHTVQDGVLVHFTENETLVCETSTTRFLVSGECEEVSCVGTVTSAEDLLVRVDPNDEVADCRPANNEGVAASRLCIF